MLKQLFRRAQRSLINDAERETKKAERDLEKELKRCNRCYEGWANNIAFAFY
jgi:hypothetical protein